MALPCKDLGVSPKLLAQAAMHCCLALYWCRARDTEEVLPAGPWEACLDSMQLRRGATSWRGPPTCALSSSMRAARSASAAFPPSTFLAKRALDCVYSCPQNTAVLGGSSRSFASDCSSTA